jgi:hypothetical protein
MHPFVNLSFSGADGAPNRHDPTAGGVAGLRLPTEASHGRRSVADPARLRDGSVSGRQKPEVPGQADSRPRFVGESPAEAGCQRDRSS